MGGCVVAIYQGQEPTENFAKVANGWLRDQKLSLKATGLLSYLRSHRSGYQLTMEQIIAEFPDGPSAVYAAMKELIERGYVQRVRRHGERNKIVGWDILVVGVDGAFPQVATSSRFSTCGEPGSGATCDDAGFSQVATSSRFSSCGSSTCGESATKKTSTKKTKDLEDEEDHSLSSDSDRDSPPAQRKPDGRERDDDASLNRSKINPQDAREVLAACNCTGDDADTVIDYWNRKPGGVKGDGWWMTVHRNGHTQARIDNALAAARREVTAPDAEQADRRRAGSRPNIPPHPFEVNSTGVDCVHCPFPAANDVHTGWTPQSPADHGFAQGMRLAAKYAALDDTNVPDTNPARREDPFFAGPWINMADGGRVQHGDPSRRANRPV
jgi:hypothetical protein